MLAAQRPGGRLGSGIAVGVDEHAARDLIGQPYRADALLECDAFGDPGDEPAGVERFTRAYDCDGDLAARAVRSAIGRPSIGMCRDTRRWGPGSGCRAGRSPTPSGRWRTSPSWTGC